MTLVAPILSLIVAIASAHSAHLEQPQARWYGPTSPNCTTQVISAPDTAAALAQTPYDILHNLGPYSPFLSLPSFTCRDIPEGFEIDQVQIYARHGARNPTTSALQSIDQTLAKFANAIFPSGNSSLDFIKNFTFTNATIQANALTAFGAKELWIMGVRYSQQYNELGNQVFVRASSDARVVESSSFFLQGFMGEAYNYTATLPQPNVIIYETNATFNDTLSIGSCPTYNNLNPDPGNVAEANWVEVFTPPIVSRLNSALNVNLNGNDIPNLISLCSFDSLKGQNWIQSPWCDVFSKEEYKQNEYYYDLSKFYDHAWGSNYGRVQGVGLVNEILARLTDTPVLEGSGTNTTLDSNSTTFPLGRKFYADFSHDNNLAMLLPALGLSWETDLPSQPNATNIPAHKFIVSNLVPFAARYIFERLVEQSTNKKYVRLIINDAVQRLDYAACGEMGITLGMCELDAFVSAQSFARQIPSEWDDICYSAPINKTVAIQP